MSIVTCGVEISIGAANNVRQFCPKLETVKLAPLLRKVLELKSVRVCNHQRTEVFNATISRGALSFNWDGRLTQRNPREPLRYVSPADSPLSIEMTVRISSKSSKAQKAASLTRTGQSSRVTSIALGAPPVATAASTALNVRYHSIRMRLVPWDEVYPEADKDHYPAAANQSTRVKWVQYKLNKLGYFAGPVNGDPASPELKKAITRYRMNHGQALFEPLLDYEPGNDDAWNEVALAVDRLGTVDFSNAPAGVFQTLVQALEANRKPRTVLTNPGAVCSPPQPGQSEIKLMVDADAYYLDGHDAAGPPGVTLDTIHLDRTTGAFVKSRRERRFLTEPHLPLEVEVLMEKSDGSGVRVPEAVGPAPISWDWESSDQRPALPAPAANQPSTVAAYVAHALQNFGAGFAAPYRHNAGRTQGGLVEADALATRNNSFVADPATPVVTADCSTRASIDPAPAAAALLGKARVWFRASTIAGDSYRVRARLDVPAEQRKPGPPPEALTNWLRIWRRIHLTAYVAWPARAAPLSNAVWDGVAAEFRHCFIEFDRSERQDLTMTTAIVRPLVFPYSPAVQHPWGPNAADTSYYFYQGGVKSERPRAFDPSASFPPGPILVTPRGAADALLISRPVKRDLNDWCTTSSRDDVKISADVSATRNLATDFVDRANALLAGAGAHYVGEFNARTHLDAGVWKWNAAPAIASRRAPAAYDDGVAPADPVTELQNAINALVTEPINEILGRGGATTPADSDLMVALWSGVNGWAEHEDLILKDAGKYLIEQMKTTGKRTGTAMRGFSWAFQAPPPASIQAYTLSDELLKNAIWGKVSGHCEKIGNSVCQDLQRYVRAEQGFGDGLIYLDAKPHVEVTSPARGRNYTYPGLNCGISGGLFMTSQFTRNDMVHLITHEMAHCMFLRHYKNAGNYQPLEHDLADDNCIMSYGFNQSAIQISAAWNSTLNCYEVQTRFADNENVAAKFEYLVEFSSPGRNLWWATFSADPKGTQRKHQGGIRVVSEGYIAKARLYVDDAAGNIDLQAQSLRDMQASTTINVPAPNVVAPPPDVAAYTSQQSVQGLVRMLGGYGDGVHYHVPNNYRPHFCGKCNLILRGWDLSGGAWPDRAP